MSLASFLLPPTGKSSGKKKAVDTDLDALFRIKTTLNSPEPTLAPNVYTVAERKKKRGYLYDDEPSRKRPKTSFIEVTSSDAAAEKQKEKRNKRVRIIPGLASESTVSDSAKVKGSGTASLDTPGLQSSDDSAGGDPSTLIHETLQKGGSRKLVGLRNSKYAPADETKERRDDRTIFIGNLVSDVSIKRPLQKQLHKHILAQIPTAKIESTRFRSVAFQTPTSKIPEASSETTKSKQPRQHDRDRTSSWRDAQTGDESKTDEKKFLTPNQKKKIAFINKAIHSDADSVHAYIVFAHPPPSHTRPTNLPPPPPVMDPFEAAHLAIEKCNGTVFLDRVLRVDTVAKRPPSEDSTDITGQSSAIGDPKLTIFVGNLDFASKEEDLRVFFEEVVSAERGLPEIGEPQDENKPKHWVTHVRMIRDKDTQLGKGFAYVQFSDRTCVDEMLALEGGKLKFAKRKLRIQRCKSAPNTTLVKYIPPAKPMQNSQRVPVPSVPKGEPSLGEKLVQLSKEERKRVKAADANRVARRMAKKHARMALAKQGVGLQSKKRDRVRKSNTVKKSDKEPVRKASKGRVRSERSIAKRNMKK